MCDRHRTQHLPELGLIEGYYGKPWSWQERTETMRFLAHAGYRFFLYAPKADGWLRRQWYKPFPQAHLQALETFAQACQEAGVRFGMGLSPYEIYLNFDETAQCALAAKLSVLDRLGIRDLALLFDDMRGDVPDLARKQVEIIHWVAARSQAQRIVVCPTYYSDDPVLDRIFGPRDPAYLSTLGQALDPSIEIFWTGEEVCSRAFSLGHLRRVRQELNRKPFIWDNYPVNDGQRMSQYLHLRGFTGRPAAMATEIAAHGINPALQPVLSRIPALTLIDSYCQGEAYEYRVASHRAARHVLGPELGDVLHLDLLALQDMGLDRLGEKAVDLRRHYAENPHPGAQEIIRWLNGDYCSAQEQVQTQ